MLTRRGHLLSSQCPINPQRKEASLEMPGNHLIVGLGGTGGRIIREIRKTLASTPQDRLAGTHFEFLYVDSDGALMKPDDPSWRVLGKSVQLERRQTLKIGGMATKPILEDLDSYPNLKSWLGDMAQMRKFLDDNVNPQAAAQRRRYGRLLFAHSAPDFIRACQQLKRALSTASRQEQITVHICCGIAGGTGGGAIVDAVAQVRKHLASNALSGSSTRGDQISDDRVLLYLVLPEQLPPGGWDSGFYHANGFASLVELNAMVAGTYRPADVAGDGSPINIAQPAFNGAYLVQNRNMAGRVIDAEHAMPQIIADFIFHKTVSAQTSEVLRAENAENGDFADEPSVDGANQHERSKRFLTFGIQRLVVPTEEIHEYFTYHYAHRASRQFLFNHWANGIGYIDRKQNIDFNAIVSDPAKLGGWLLSDEHLTLSRPILPTDGINPAGRQTWQPFVQFWPTVANAAAMDIKASDTKQEGWITALQAVLNQIQAQGFRSAGIANFFLQKSQAVTQMAAQVRGAVEKELFTTWRNGQYGIADLQALLEALIRHVDGKLKAAPGAVATLTDRADQSRKALAAVIQENSGVGLLSKYLGNKREALFDAAKEHLTVEHIHRTNAEGWTFAQSLLPLVLRELNGLLSDITELYARMQRTGSQFEQQFNARLQSQAGRAAVDPQAYEHKTKLFDLTPLQSIRDTLLADQSRQNADAQLFRDAIFNELGGDAGFSTFLSRFPEGALMEKLETMCDTAAARAVEQLPPPQRATLTPNIVEKLSQTYSAQDSGLMNFVLEKVSASAPYGTFDKSEVSKVGGGTSTPGQGVKETCVIAVPASANASAFRSTLVDTFRGQLPPSIESVRVHDTGVPDNEVTIYQIHNLYPVRWLSHTAFLRDKYNLLTKNNPSAAYFVHGEGALRDFAPLFIPSATALTASIVPHLLVAFAAEILHKAKNATTGREEIVCTYTDSDGYEVRVSVGASEKEALAKIPSETALLIKRRVEEMLASEEFRLAEAREALYKKAVAFINGYKDSILHGDASSSEYLKLRQDGQEAKSRLLKLA
ncbi:hypothetical protein HZ992_18850 [Rhizobacter sp. AJA081-3]|uniref:tubulin-like doman-containing protein n=1 Tax=Rhizobacter sp. AJA081-3 TaxID=2753607 RepID=UPI001AE06D22|nr:tubulin-like doman-containing protein [Rhizobacter sp. AJA081-3]QTN22200.1 hypothetical protein HZ992_18850 [Rhizobacter sp. AJA081-3]